MNVEVSVYILHDCLTCLFCCVRRLPVVSECSPQQTARVSVAAGSSGSVSAAASAAAAAAVVAGAPSSSTMSVSRVPSPPPSSEANTPVAENWCYTQVSTTAFAAFFVSHNVFQYAAARYSIL